MKTFGNRNVIKREREGGQGKITCFHDVGIKDGQ